MVSQWNFNDFESFFHKFYVEKKLLFSQDLFSWKLSQHTLTFLNSTSILNKYKIDNFSFIIYVATPLWPSVRMKLTLPKLGTWSLLGLSKTQSLIAGVKTPRIEVFLISLERSRSVDVRNGLA